MIRPVSLRALEEARRWIGTPYHHRAAKHGVGCDCLGFLAGVAATVYGLPMPALPAYTRDWNEASGREVLADGLGALFERIKVEEASAGDVLVFRMLRRPPAKHVAILDLAPSTRGTPWRDGFIIDSQQVGGVARRPLSRDLYARTAFAFRFPDQWPKSS